MSDKHTTQAQGSDYDSPTPHDSRYTPFTQQPSCCVPTCIQMVMYRNDIPLRPAEEIGYHLGLVVSPDRSKLFRNVRTAADAPPAGYGIQMHIPEYEPNAAFARMNIPLAFSVEPIASIPSANELLKRLSTHEQDDHDVIVAFNLGALLCGRGAGQQQAGGSGAGEETSAVDDKARHQSSPIRRGLVTDLPGR